MEEEDRFARYRSLNAGNSNDSGPNVVNGREEEEEEGEEEAFEAGGEEKDPDGMPLWRESAQRKAMEESRKSISSRNGSMKKKTKEGSSSSSSSVGDGSSKNEEAAVPISMVDSATYGLESFGDKSNARLGNHDSQLDGPQKINRIPFQAVKQVACGEFLSIVLLASGQVWQWGNGNPIPVLQKGFKRRVVQVACGYDHLCAITEQETQNLYTWGRNDYGQLGHGHKNVVVKPKAIQSFPTGTRIVYVSCGHHFTVAISMTGNVYSWGQNTEKQLGLGHNFDQFDAVAQPERMEHLSRTFKTNKGNGGDDDDVDDILEYSRLMINSGKEHSVSWVATHGSFMQAEQQVAFRELSKRIGELEHRLREANTTIERLRKENKSAKLLAAKAISNQDDPNNLENESSSSMRRRDNQFMNNGIVVNTNNNNNNNSINYNSGASINNAANSDSMKNDSSGLTVVSRRINKDPKVEEIDHLLSELENKSFRIEKHIQDEKQKIVGKEADIQGVKRVIQSADESVLHLWGNVEQCNLKINQEKGAIQPSTFARRGRQIEKLKQELSDNEHMALTGEKAVQQEVARLTKLEGEAALIRKNIATAEKDLDNLQAISKVLGEARQDRVKEIKHNFIETQVPVIHEWIEKSRKILDDLQHSNIDKIAASLNEQTTKPVPSAPSSERHDGIRDLLQMSNERINSIVVRAKQELGLEGSHQMLSGRADLNDAGLEFVSVMLASIQESAQVRKENNFYISHLMGLTQQQVDKLAFKQ